jgi:hypothetical protein
MSVSGRNKEEGDRIANTRSSEHKNLKINKHTNTLSLSISLNDPYYLNQQNLKFQHHFNYTSP